MIVFWGLFGLFFAGLIAVGVANADQFDKPRGQLPPPAAVAEKPETLAHGFYATVAEDQITKYGIAKRNGSKTDACGQAMMVSAALLQANDEAGYAKWKKIEAEDCKP